MSLAPKIFTIPFVPMSRNTRDRVHWSQRHKELSDWTLQIPMCEESSRQKEGERRMVEIVFRKARGPLQDKDNLWARAKVPLDAIKNRGWITDDSPTHIELLVREEVTGKRGQTIIAISEIREKRNLTPDERLAEKLADRKARLEAELEQINGQIGGEAA